MKNHFRIYSFCLMFLPSLLFAQTGNEAQVGVISAKIESLKTKKNAYVDVLGENDFTRLPLGITVPARGADLFVRRFRWCNGKRRG